MIETSFKNVERPCVPSSTAKEKGTGLYKPIKQGSEAEGPWNEPPGGLSRVLSSALAVEVSASAMR
jgi:hypothetical protein